jgi:hypothetical protein
VARECAPARGARSRGSHSSLPARRSWTRTTPANPPRRHVSRHTTRDTTHADHRNPPPPLLPPAFVHGIRAVQADTGVGEEAAIPPRWPISRHDGLYSRGERSGGSRSRAQRMAHRISPAEIAPRFGWTRARSREVRSRSTTKEQPSPSSPLTGPPSLDLLHWTCSFTGPPPCSRGRSSSAQTCGTPKQGA